MPQLKAKTSWKSKIHFLRKAKEVYKRMFLQKIKKNLVSGSNCLYFEQETQWLELFLMRTPNKRFLLQVGLF